MTIYTLTSDYPPAGDQPQAIAQLVTGVAAGDRDQVLLGVTGSGKTYTMANVIAESNRPAVIMAHNKTLAAQLYTEFKEFFPQDHVEYFVSYYDYYQPEAYVAKSDTYIEKDASINEQIDRLRHSATRALLEQRNCVVVASVSCIYGLGSPELYLQMSFAVKQGEEISMRQVMDDLVELQYKRNDMAFQRGTFRVRGDVLDIFPSHYEDRAWRLSFFGDEVEDIYEFDSLTGERLDKLEKVTIFANTHHITPRPTLLQAVELIKAELKERIKTFEAQGKLLEAQRIEQRTNFDLEMILETGSCKGIENYSRYLSGRKTGEPPPTLFEYLPEDALLFIDESHVTLPQIGGMYNGDRARKANLVEHGFRLPSALDNRPLKMEEWERMRPQTIHVSATPGKWEMEAAKRSWMATSASHKHDAKEAPLPTSPRKREEELSGSPRMREEELENISPPLAGGIKGGQSHNQRNKHDLPPYIVQQVIRPTGLVDPVCDVRPATSQVDDVIHECQEEIKKGRRVLITTLTKKMAENLTDYLLEVGLKTTYMHSDIDTLERVEIINDLRRGDVDVLVGINLLREGLDIPETGLVAILDADKTGFLRSETSLVQTIGRAARNADGRVILYADEMTDALKDALAETDRRREIQLAYNEEHGITPKTIIKKVQESLRDDRKLQKQQEALQAANSNETLSIDQLKKRMMEAASNLEFEEAARLRDEIHQREQAELGLTGS